MAYTLSDYISFRNFRDFCILIDHFSKNSFKMNHSAGLILEKIKRQKTDFSGEELDFIKILEDHHIIKTKTLPEEEESRKISLKSRKQKQTILNDLQTYAQQNIIPLNCEIELTHRCPLGCKHCYLASETPLKNEELTTNQIKNFISELAKLGGLFLTFTGGEPFLRDDFEEIFDYARKEMFAVSILTSGINYDSDKLKRIADKVPDSVQVSIHGYDEKTHDYFTGVKGSFTSAIKTLETLKDLNVQVLAAVSVHKMNFDYADKIFAMLKSKNIEYNINLNMLPQISHRKTSDLQLGKEEISYIATKYLKRKHFRNAGLKHDDFICSAGRSTLALDPYGNIFPCVLLRENSGSIKKSPLAETWNDSDILNNIRNLRFRDLKDCPDCQLSSSCNRCSGLAFLSGFKITNHSKLDCIQASVYNEQDCDSDI